MATSCSRPKRRSRRWAPPPSISLPPRAPRSATYSLNATVGNAQQGSIAGGFYVEDYKKPEYAVTVTPSQPRVLQGNTTDATIEAKYYFGEPVAGASVKYVVHTSTYWSPFIDRDEEDDSMGQSSDADTNGDTTDDEEYAGEQISEQSGTLDANGRLVVHIPTRIDEHHYDVRYRIEARVTDEANREISGANSVIATYGSFAVGINTQSYVYKKGDKIQADAVAKDYDGNPDSHRRARRIAALELPAAGKWNDADRRFHRRADRPRRHSACILHRSGHR